MLSISDYKFISFNRFQIKFCAECEQNWITVIRERNIIKFLHLALYSYILAFPQLKMVIVSVCFSSYLVTKTWYVNFQIKKQFHLNLLWKKMQRSYNTCQSLSPKEILYTVLGVSSFSIFLIISITKLRAEGLNNDYLSQWLVLETGQATSGLQEDTSH